MDCMCPFALRICNLGVCTPARGSWPPKRSWPPILFFTARTCHLGPLEVGLRPVRYLGPGPISPGGGRTFVLRKFSPNDFCQVLPRLAHNEGKAIRIFTPPHAPSLWKIQSVLACKCHLGKFFLLLGYFNTSSGFIRRLSTALRAGKQTNRWDPTFPQADFQGLANGPNHQGKGGWLAGGGNGGQTRGGLRLNPNPPTQPPHPQMSDPPPRM